MSWDVIVVGAGSAGCIVASRLAENKDRHVLLIEAGGTVPDIFLSGMRPNPPELDWGLKDVQGQWVARGRCFGGSAAINYGMWIQGPCDDYEWGHPDWTFDKVRPAIERLDALVPTDITWPTDPASLRFFSKAAELGIQRNDHLDQPNEYGYGPMPRNLRDGRRITSAEAYLSSHSSNLEIRLQSEVQRIVRGGIIAGGEMLQAEDVILCAGAYGSPRLLLESGIGTALPVGEGLAEHPGLVALLEQPDGVPDANYCGVVILESVQALLFPAGPDECMLRVYLMDPQSTGKVTTNSIDRGLLKEPDDRARMHKYLAWAYQLVEGLQIRSAPDISEFPPIGLTGYNHPSCTCAFGEVVDERLRVIGEEHIFVCDTSVFPRIPTANTNKPTMIVAERFSELYRAEYD